MRPRRAVLPLNIVKKGILYLNVLRVIPEKKLTELRDIFNYLLVATEARLPYLTI